VEETSKLQIVADDIDLFRWEERKIHALQLGSLISRYLSKRNFNTKKTKQEVSLERSAITRFADSPPPHERRPFYFPLPLLSSDPKKGVPPGRVRGPNFKFGLEFCISQTNVTLNCY